MAGMLDQKSVLILGLGISGLAMARWCARQGANVIVADSREAPPNLAKLQAEVPQARFVSGAFGAGLLDGNTVRAVFVSPGLAPQDTAAVLEPARAQGLWVGGELDLFAQALRMLQEQQGYAPKVLGITGTNGKTTVTSLTTQLVERAGLSVAMAGNIGPTLLDTLSAAIDAEALPQAWVLELSSFQLNDCSSFEPTAATILNVSQDHLDWHGDMDAYVQAKANIFGQQGVAVLNRDDPVVMALLPQLAPQSQPGYKAAKGEFQRDWISFGFGMPSRPGDFGLEEVNGMVWLVRAGEQDETLKGKRARAAAEEELYIQRLMPADALRIRGRHNASNALAALALALQTGAPLAPMLYGLREYRGEPHRVEPVGIVEQVEYFDDSKGTNVGATLAALNGLGADRQLVVILGGEGKGQDFAPLAPAVQRCCRAVVLIGRDAPLIEAALQATGVPLLHADSMQTAVNVATEQAQAGDAVLLSPACASFDMFKDYADRAHQFCAAVAQLAEDRGASLEGAA